MLGYSKGFQEHPRFPIDHGYVPKLKVLLKVYAKSIVQPWTMHCTCLLWSNLSLDMLTITKIIPKCFRRFQNPPATQEIKL